MKRFTPALLAALVVIGLSTARAAEIHADRPLLGGGYALSSAMAIGGADADDDAAFYERFGAVRLDADADGNVYVMDSGNVRIQVFGPDGGFVRSLGAEGQGPGEFQIMGRISVNAAGSVAVSDLGQGRISVLDANGKLLWDRLVGDGAVDVCLTDAGVLYLGYGDRGPAAVEAFDSSGKLLLRAGTNEAPGDMVMRVEIGSQTVAPRLQVLDDGRIFRAPKGVYVVQAFSADGGGERDFRRPFERREIDPAELFPEPEEGEDGPQVVMIRKEMSPDGGQRTTASTSSEWHDDEGVEMSFDADRLRRMMPKHHPDTRGVLAWPDGRVWVVTSHDEKGGMVTDEWSADGEYLRRFTIPSEYDQLRIGADGSLYGVSHDEDDYPTAHRIEVKTEA